MSWLIWVMAIFAAVKPVDPNTLELWEAPPPLKGQRAPKAKLYELSAVDLDGDQLITLIATGNLIILPVNKPVTAHIMAPSKELAYGVVSVHLGFSAVPPKLKGRGASVDLRFAAAPVDDLFHLLSDVGHLNIVAPGPLPKVDIITSRQPWDGVLAEVIRVIGRTSTRFGNTAYVLPAGGKLPELPKLPKAAAKAVIELDVAGATAGQALAALRELADVPLGVCESPVFTLKLRHVRLPEALRAIEVMTGTTLTADGAQCPKLRVSKLSASPAADTKLVGIVTSGTKRVALFDRKGEALTATADGTVVKAVGASVVDLASSSLQLHATDYVDPWGASADSWLANAKRVAALIHEADRWTAVVDGPKGFRLVDPDHMIGNPTDLNVSIDDGGVHPTVSGGKKPDIVLSAK